MTEGNQAPGIASLVGKLVRTGIGAVQNRFELLALEWEEERARLTELLVWAAGLVFMAVMAAILLTLTVILLFPEDRRVYVAAGFAVIYALGAFFAWRGLQKLVRREPFAETIEQANRDKEWLKSFE